MLEGPPPSLPKGPIILKPPLDTILQVSSALEKESTILRGEETLSDQRKQDDLPQIPKRTLEDIPEVDEDMVVTLWREVQIRANEQRSGT